MRYILLGFFLLLFFTPVQTNAQDTCHTYTDTTTSNPGYGVAYNVYTNVSDILLTTKCDALNGQVTVRAGMWGGTQLIYEKGYIIKNNVWEPFFFEDVNKEGSWITGLASKAFLLSDQEMVQSNFFLAYVCTLVSGEWKCGCKDAACAEQKWQIQQFDFGFSSQEAIRALRGMDRLSDVQAMLEGARVSAILCDINDYQINNAIAGGTICDVPSGFNALWPALPAGWTYSRTFVSKGELLIEVQGEGYVLACTETICSAV